MIYPVVQELAADGVPVAVACRVLEVSTSGYINSRYLDDKAGVAVMFATIKAMKEARIKPRVDTYMLFTIAEEVG